jgi:hypothetical protein
MSSGANIRTLHHEAMRIASLADKAMANNDGLNAIAMYAEAFSKEKEFVTALLVTDANSLTKSVMIRSAATLGYLAGQNRDAEKLVAIGLSMDIPHKIAEELRDLYENINMSRHLELRGIKLSTTEFRMVIHGNIVAHGIAPSQEIKSRQEIAEKLALRTAERIKNKPFRSKGNVDSEIREMCRLYQYVPEAASFAIVFRLGDGTHQTSIFGEQSFAERTIQEMYNGLEAIAAKDSSKLSELIPDPTYRSNFLHLAKGLAPDGDRIKMVGFTVSNGQKPESFQMTNTQAEISKSLHDVYGAFSALSELDSGDPLSVKGELRMADDSGKRASIKIVGQSSQTKITVPEGLADIVKIHWGAEVVAWYRKDKKINVLDRLEPA